MYIDMSSLVRTFVDFVLIVSSCHQDLQENRVFVYFLCSRRVAYSNQFVRPSFSQSIRLSVRPSLFCPEHNFKTMQGINMKLHRKIDLIEEKCSAQ